MPAMKNARIPKARRLAPYISARKLGTEIQRRDENYHEISEQNADPEVLGLKH